MTWTLCIHEVRDRTGQASFELFAYAECADGRPMSQDLATLKDRHTAIALARYCAEEDPEYVLSSAEIVPFSKCRSRAA